MLKARILVQREVHRRGWTLHKTPTFLKRFYPNIPVVLGRRIKVNETLPFFFFLLRFSNLPIPDKCRYFQIYQLGPKA